MDTDGNNEVRCITVENYNRPDIRSRALPTTMYSSQVCQRWRNFLLGSSFLWGRVVDLELLFVAKESWRAEVLRRTGQALLHVKGRVDSIKRLQAQQRAVFSFLVREWSRIQKINIRIGLSEEYWPSGTRTFWELFQHPAEHLELFHLSVQLSPRLMNLLDNEICLTTRLLSDHAPSLRNFFCTNLWFKAPQMVIFSGKIHTIAIDHSAGYTLRPAFSFSVHEFLAGLAETPCLERLRLHQVLKRSLSTGMNRLSKPMPQSWAELLRYITPGDQLRRFQIVGGCYAGLETLIEEETTFALPELFSTYAQACFSCYRPPVILMNIGCDSFRIYELDSDYSQNRIYPSSKLSIRVSSWRNYASNNSNYLRVFLPWFAPAVIHLHIRKAGISPTSQSVAGFPSFPILASFFTSVTTVRLDMASLEAFTSTTTPDDSDCVLLLGFASLQRLELIERFRLLQVAEYQQVIADFLSQRMRAGKPVAVLDFSFNDPDPQQRGVLSLKWLDRFTGLRILWRTSKETTTEYVCGRTFPLVEV
ncbi:hypothetical protein GALMADRAFT_139519 [Galerina marginata CBS 339.88]|uniref:F-box domain-containing protein n=1 Tax=Galerina marginata (strain CBS 339.88) TaxID=685588 RepID=A0A067T088_GALM3|nr:hypothetical protein GALMADRAFT_139519 [Galerina marginata CBS 339.88]